MWEKHYTPPPPKPPHIWDTKSEQRNRGYKNEFPDFVSRNVGNSIKCEKNITPPNPPPFEIQKQNKGIEDIMDIDSNCPHLLFGETTSHLTSKWRVTFQYYYYYFFNVENSMKREMRKNCFYKKKNSTPPPPPNFFLHHFFFFLMLEIAWNVKKTWNFEKKILKILFFFNI